MNRAAWAPTDSAEEAQKEATWPSDAQRVFAAVLNENRAILGLSALTLNSPLCQACLDHSQEMSALGYFSHDSPTPGRRTPAARATAAGYRGHVQGENLYMGSGSTQAAYEAWWRSDGHRKTMFAEGPTELGVAHYKQHWTLMMGRARTPPTP